MLVSMSGASHFLEKHFGVHVRGLAVFGNEYKSTIRPSLRVISGLQVHRPLSTQGFWASWI